jgi:transposase
MKVLHIIGADLSKKSIDFANPEGEHIKVSNDPAGYRQFMEWIRRQKINIPEMMMVMEHTGLYSYRLEQFLHAKEISFTKVPALAIKRSMGLVRGKNDKVDAIRIARYGAEKRDSLVSETPVDKALERLQMLHRTRDRLVRLRAGIIKAVKEYRDSCDLNKDDLIMRTQLQLISSFDRQIAKLDDAIAAILESEESLKKNDQLLQSITAVGKVVSVATIIKTRNFTKFPSARKFASYCGTAPFENSSGTSIRGKTRVSKLRDKDMNRLLDLAAKSAIQYDKELREYYLKRTASGKSKMSTINIVRNKILYRMFAVIKRQTPFIKDYPKSA